MYLSDKINRLGCVYVILVHLTNIFCQYEQQNTMLRLLQHLFSTAAESIKDKKKIVRRHCCKNSTCLSIAYIVKNVFYDLVYNRSFSIYFILSFDSWQQHQYPFINTKSLSRFAEYTIDIYIYIYIYIFSRSNDFTFN